MADEKKTSRLSIVKDVVGIVIPIVGLATIVLSYYQYFYDILKQPSLIVNSSLSRIDTTPAYHVIKMVFEIENPTNAKVEVLSNRCEIYGMWGFAFYQDDTTFRKTTQESMKKVDSFPIWETNRNYIPNGEAVSFLQLYPNHFWLMPKEKQKLELVTVVPKWSPKFRIPYQRVRLFASFTFGTSAANIIVIDSIDKDGIISSNMYLKDGKKQRKLSFKNHDDSLFLEKHCVAQSITYSDVWLNSGADELPTYEEYQEFQEMLEQLLSGYQSSGGKAAPVHEQTGNSQPVKGQQQVPKVENAPPEEKAAPVRSYNLTGTWINHSNNSKWEFKQTGNTLSFDVFKSSGKKKGQGSGTVGNGYVSITYNDFTFDIYKGVLNITSDGKMLEGTLTSNSGLNFPYVLDRE